MGKASKAKRQGSTRQQRIAAQRAAARRAEIRNRILIASGSVVVIVAIVLAFVLVKVNSHPSKATSANGPTGTALATVVKNTTTVPASTLNSVGAGSGVSGLPKPISGGTLLKSGGKPEVLYMGAEYCPYCAAERWGMVVALSRFGTFKNLSTTHSASNDEFPNTSTWTFYKSTYSSKYLTFAPVEMQTNKLASDGQSYTTLQTPTAAQNALLNKYDAPPYVASSSKGAIPFVDIGNKYMLSGASFSPQILQGKTWSQIAAALKDPSSPIAKAVDGTANYITAAICKTTGNQPASACTPAVKKLEAKL
jgi:hypothetical protein